MNPHTIVATIKINLTTFYREKSALFFTFIFPIMLMLLFGFIFEGSEDTTYIIYVQDLDDTDMSRNLTTILDQIESIELHKVSKDVDVKKYMKDNDVNFLVIIPEGYQERIFTKMAVDPNATVNLTIKYDPSVQSTGIKLSLLNSVLQEVNKGLAGASDTIFIETNSIVSDNFSYIEFFIPGVIGLTIMANVTFNIIFGEMENKQKGIIRKLSTTPITRGDWIFSNMIFQLFMAMISTVMILIVGFLIFGAVMYLNGMMAFLLIVETFAFTGLAMLVTRVAHDASSASVAGNLITFPMMFLSGSFFQVEDMPDFLQIIAQLLPLYYVNEGLREAMIFNDTVAAIPHAVVISIFAIIVFVAGVYLTTWKTD